MDDNRSLSLTLLQLIILMQLVAHPLSAARQLENGVVDIEETVADNIFIITVMQCEHSDLGVSYTVRDNFLVASADVREAGLLVKRCSISSIPVFEVDGGVSAGDALSSVWLPGVVPPLIVGLESLLEMGENAIITLPMKCNAPKGYYKAPPPHLLRQREEREDDSRKRNWSSACTPDIMIDLPKSRVVQTVTVSNS